MAIERRESGANARIFIPTASEKSIVAKRKRLNKDLKEVDQMKKELQGLIDKLKDK